MVWWVRVRGGVRENATDPTPLVTGGANDVLQYTLCAEDEGCVFKVKYRPVREDGMRGEVFTSKPTGAVVCLSSERRESKGDEEPRQGGEGVREGGKEVDLGDDCDDSTTTAAAAAAATTTTTISPLTRTLTLTTTAPAQPTALL